MAKTDKEKYLEFWGYELGTPEAEEAWEAKLKMMYGPKVEAGFQVMGDGHYDGMRAHDGSDISTRSKHREFMKRTGLVTFDDYASTFSKEQEKRDAYHRGETGSVSRRDIERTFDRLMGN